MTECPACKAWVPDDAKECPKCGLIFEKWEKKVASAVIALERPPSERKNVRIPPIAFVFLVTLMIAVVGLFIALERLKAKRIVAHQGQVSFAATPTPDLTPVEPSPTPEEATATPTPLP